MMPPRVQLVILGWTGVYFAPSSDRKKKSVVMDGGILCAAASCRRAQADAEEDGGKNDACVTETVRGIL